VIFEAFLKLLFQSHSLAKTNGAAVDEQEEITVVDLEETGYQASFSKLGASEPVRNDPIPDVADPGVFMAKSLSECSKANPGKVSNYS
jgi:exportin-2 (importin alpha re-exporter)